LRELHLEEQLLTGENRRGVKALSPLMEEKGTYAIYLPTYLAAATIAIGSLRSTNPGTTLAIHSEAAIGKAEMRS